MKKIIKFKKLSFSDIERKILNKDIINNKKKINKILSDARKQSKNDRCIVCGKKVDSFCNSHTVPAFCLKTISDKGKIYNANKIIGIPIIEKEKGVKNSGTFHLICNKCDNEIFQDYENPENYNKNVNGKILAEIAMKNYLKFIYKRNMELKMLGSCSKYNEIKRLDLKEFNRCFEKARCFSKKDDNDQYLLISRITLNYTVPIAYQGIIALIFDLEGKLINNIYNKNPKYRIGYLHICVFPFKNKTEVLLFTEKNDKRYRNFSKQFRKMKIDKQLSIVNYIILLYTEDYFVSKTVKEEIFNNKKIKEISAMTTDPFTNFEQKDSYELLELAQQVYNLKKCNEIPNFLSKENQLL